jgi:HSP20 family protein
MKTKSVVPASRERPLASIWGEPFVSLQQEIDRLFDDFGMRFGGDVDVAGAKTGLVPTMDVVETDKAFELTAELPGLEEKDVSIDLADNVLTIKGEKKSDREEKGANFRRVERRYGSFMRAIELPAGVKPDSIEAKLAKGVLTVTIPKPEKAATKSIAVKSAA